MFEFKDNIDKFGNDIIKLGKLLLSNKEFDDLYNFHKKSWGLDGNTEYDYRVYASNNTFNMNEIFTRIFQFENSGTEEEKKLEHIRNTTFLTKNGLFCCAKDIVDFYKKNGRFPRILFVFDYTDEFHREIFDVLIKLEYIIYDLLDIDVNNLDAVAQIRQKLYRKESVNIKLYASWISKRTLLSYHYQKSLNIEKKMNSSDFLSFVFFLNDYIKRLGFVQNKSYLPLISVDANDEFVNKTCKETHKYEYYPLRYYGNHYIWAKKDNNKHFLTARKFKESFYILPMYFFNEISKSEAREFIKYFKYSSRNRVIQLLNDSHDELLPLQMQLISCILSYVIFCEFAEENNITNYHIDIERVCMNFGLQSEYLQDMKSLFRYLTASKLLREQLFEYANTFLNMKPFSLNVNTLNTDFTKNVCAAEDFLSEIDFKNSKYESDMRDSEGYFSAETPKRSTVSLEKFLNGAHCENDLKTMIATLLLIKYGYIENDIELSQKKETIQTLIRAK